MVRWFFLGIFAIAVGVVLFLQHETNENLRGEITLLREEQRELAQLRKEHDKLAAAQPSAAEWERLQADRAALVQLRAEIDAMKTRAARDASQSNSASTAAANTDAAARSSAKQFKVALGSNGNLALDGRPMPLDGVRAQLASLPRGTPIDLLVILESNVRPEDLKATAEGLSNVAKEFGLPLKMRFEQP